MTDGELIPEDNTSLFHFDDGKPSFEHLGKPNGQTTWSCEDLREALGYSASESFEKVIAKGKTACLQAGVTQEEHIIYDHQTKKHRLTRFGCFIVSMNGDPSKPNVAKAQAYFAALAESFQSSEEIADGVDRVLIRSEVSDGQKSLSSTASRQGVQRYDFFLNKGYMGMYNMSLDKLRHEKGIGKNEKLMDRIGKTELAANLFRITQTEQKIKTGNIRGQAALENAAHSVGRSVRDAMININGTKPEDLPIAEPIQSVKKNIKQANKNLSRIDKKPKKKKKS